MFEDKNHFKTKGLIYVKFPTFDMFAAQLQQRMKPAISVFLIFFALHAIAQTPGQNIRGVVTDKATKHPLAGATVIVDGIQPPLGAVTDTSGHFLIRNVPVGRRAVRCQYPGFEPFLSEELILTSVREVSLNVEMGEDAGMMETVTIHASQYANLPLNELATVSARSFSVEETERIAASVNDLGRMALAFPGVSQGTDDSENDILIRGNSSFGMLWRLEGIDIPNPNHFARPGTSGGGITVFSAQLLSRSDFFSGGMPAEYGNALAGAMDIHFRHGNQETQEYRAKASLIGLDFAAEGPIEKGRSSYLVNARYSTLGLLNKIGFYLVGDRVSDDFQDISFNLNFDGKDKRNNWTVFGLGGLSLEHYTPITNPAKRVQGVADNWEDRQQGSNLGVLGVTYTRLIDDHSYLKAVVASSNSEIFRRFDTLNLQDVHFRFNTQHYVDSRISTALSYTRRLAPGLQLKTGLIAHQIFFSFYKQTAPRSPSTSNVFENQSQTSFDGRGQAQMFQAYANLSKTFRKWTINGGIHWLSLLLNQTNSIEPRVSAKYALSARQTITFAAGLYGQTLPLAAYFYEQSDTVNGAVRTTRPNFNAKIIQSRHLILGYDHITTTKWRYNVETYVQYTTGVPVENNTSSVYWMLNEKEEFPEKPIVSEGKGLNYGLDMSVEKFFSNSYYLLLHGSVFKASYAPLNGQYYNSRFNTSFTSGLSVGKEFALRKSSVLQAGIRMLVNGGFRYSPLDPVRSAAEKQYVPLAGKEWTAQVKPYRRVDARVAWRFNKRHTAGTVSVDIQNLTNYPNLSGVAYNAVTNSLNFSAHPAGFVPVLGAQVDF
jgi:hypothetical protein